MYGRSVLSIGLGKIITTNNIFRFNIKNSTILYLISTISKIITTYNIFSDLIGKNSTIYT